MVYGSMVVEKEFIAMWDGVSEKIKRVEGTGVWVNSDSYVVIDREVYLYFHNYPIGKVDLKLIKEVK